MSFARGQKSGSFDYAEGSASCIGRKPKVPMRVWLKVLFKNAESCHLPFYLYHVKISKHSQLICLSTWSIWCAYRFYF